MDTKDCAVVYRKLWLISSEDKVIGNIKSKVGFSIKFALNWRSDTLWSVTESVPAYCHGVCSQFRCSDASMCRVVADRQVRRQARIE